ncbi:MAG TPA: saccharopine dehydrogenase NADP-binding domain-containing protein [Burkholderiaceae bacterium]|nr:saccharopine dehydrogenase NADP-binding domain-containing protein [Burkholderiaceae bacterium]
MHHPLSKRPILVYGAAGHTASFVIASLLGQGHQVVLAGHDEARLQKAFPGVPASEFRLFELGDPDRTRRAIAGSSMVVNCAGPFADTTEHLLQAALETGAHYLDIAAEQAVARAVLEQWNDRTEAAGVIAVPAMGFYGGLGDLLATAAMHDWTDADEVSVYIALDSWHPTAGTRRTGQRNAGRYLVFSGGRLQPPPATTPRTTWQFPDDFGVQQMIGISAADVVTIPSHLRVQNVPAWINEAPIEDLHNTETPPPVAVDDSGRSAQRFSVQVVARRGGVERRAAASGQDIYAVTGPLVAQAATRILAMNGRRKGSLSAGQLFDAREFLLALSPQPLSLVLER